MGAKGAIPCSASVEPRVPARPQNYGVLARHSLTCEPCLLDEARRERLAQDHSIFVDADGREAARAFHSIVEEIAECTVAHPD